MSDNNDLLSFVSSVSGDSYLKVEETLGDGYVRLKVSEAERRQAKHDIRGVEDIVVELLRNARDAHAQRIFVASSREADIRSLVIVDDGVGIPEGMAERIFEPRVTSKLDTMVMDRWGVHGRGMALYSIRQNVESAVVASTGLHKGASIVVSADTARLPERTDQSTWPTVVRDDSAGLSVTRGPHNILRRTVEFALEHEGIDVYIGSITEVLATLVVLARFELDESDLLCCEDLRRLPVWQRPGAAVDAVELTDTASRMGLEVSERTAHRILAGDIVPTRPVMATLIAGFDDACASQSADIYRDRRGLRIASDDLDRFQAELERAFDSIAARYYVHLKSAPRITVGKEEIRVRFDVEKED
jgi:hypothetical protein